MTPKSGNDGIAVAPELGHQLLNRGALSRALDETLVVFRVHGLREFG